MHARKIETEPQTQNSEVILYWLLQRSCGSAESIVKQSLRCLSTSPYLTAEVSTKVSSLEQRQNPVNSWNEWDPLEEVIVGCPGGAAVPPFSGHTQVAIIRKYRAYVRVSLGRCSFQNPPLFLVRFTFASCSLFIFFLCSLVLFDLFHWSFCIFQSLLIFLLASGHSSFSLNSFLHFFPISMLAFKIVGHLAPGLPILGPWPTS